MTTINPNPDYSGGLYGADLYGDVAAAATYNFGAFVDRGRKYSLDNGKKMWNLSDKRKEN